MSCTKCSSITLFKGEDGKTVLNGAGAPAAGVGVVGDFYIDTTNWEIYGPKTASGWGSGTSIVGATGAQGLYGGWSSEWLYDGTATTSGTASGDFRFNNGTLSSVTTLYINDTNADSTNLQAFLDAWNNSGDFGLVRISKKTDANVFWMGVVTAETDSGSEHSVTVTHTVSNGSFTDNDPCIISFVESGANGTNGADATDLYDSDWVSIGTHNGTFGLPALTNWTNPKLRVIGHQVYITGRIMLPLATSGAPTTLLPNVTTYPIANNQYVQIYTGSSGGYTVSGNGSITSQQMIPTDLTPQENVEVHTHSIVTRAIQSTAGGGGSNLTLSTILPTVRFNTDGKLLITTWKDVWDSAGLISSVENSPIRSLIMHVDSGSKAINYSAYKQQYTVGSSVTTYEVQDVGSGYTTGTSVAVTTTTLSGAGVGATFDVTVSATGEVSTISINSSGAGYADGDLILLNASTGTPSIGAGSGAVIKVNIDDSNSNVDGRVVSVASAAYPVTFDGQDETHLGGFTIPITISYPIDSTLTEAQITAAIATM